MKSDLIPCRYPEELPVSARCQEILEAIQAHQVVVVAGETGSGKTTQLPKICLEAGLAEYGRIGCTQPRRVAAMSVSRRVAEELGASWGREVGCKMRFNDDTSRQTRIKFMTDGILLAEVQSDPLLRAYSALIIDEAHERSLNIDFLLGYLQELLRRRPELKLIITSATIDTEAFSKAFGNAPVIEVSGRLFPVEMRYQPSEQEEPVEAAARAVEDALLESEQGDLLVFMPTERDIRETRELLESSVGGMAEVLGLYGRMPAAEQQRLFTPGTRRRVIVATNVAETSLTLPRIRYVIDSGLARISRYNPRTRTKRLPVEAISQSSANQRAGRAGRVQDGICIRLYSEEDFQKRPRFTQPEIQRANLAEVILRMKAFRLGDIERFPFIDPPQQAAVRGGYQLLHELAAMDEEHRLTPLGHELARLPVDPTLGRMLLQARHENALPEMLVIAAGLSVPDPRERPEEAREAAAAAQSGFADATSDFLSLLNLWNASPNPENRSSGNALRRFCKAHYLSLSRMREWRDIHGQLAEAVGWSGRAQPAASGEALHRSILSGLLGHLAKRKERNVYVASGNREVTLFPGSHLYERKEKVRKSGKPQPRSSQPEWIMAGEIVQTSMLFARTAAGIDPAWAVELGQHLCKCRYTEPHWSAKAGRVLVSERVLMHGLELRRRWVDYGPINPAEATELFIRGALVAAEARIALRFFEHNRRVVEKIESALTRVRSRRAHDLDEALYQFYAERIEGVSSVHDLNRFVKARLAMEPDFLCATEADLIGGEEAVYDRGLFPDHVAIGNSVLPISYAYSPGEERDGVTLQVPLAVADQLSSGQIQWMVPGIREELISVLLRALPKSIRRTLMPLEPKVPEIARAFEPARGDFLVALADFLTRTYGERIRAEDWPPNSLPAHLQPRIEVIDGQRKTIAASRDLAAIQARAEISEDRSAAWTKACQQWEQRALTRWSIGDLPESVLVERSGVTEIFGCPGLALRDGEVDLRLFRKAEEAIAESKAGVRRLAELILARDVAWLRKELSALGKERAPQVRQGLAALDQLNVKREELSSEVLQESAYCHLLTQLFALDFPLTEARFLAMLEKARRELPSVTYKLCQQTKQILALRGELLALPKPYPELAQDVQRLAPADFLSITPPERLADLPRYLKAVHIRAERARLNPAKDAEKAKHLLPFKEWRSRVAPQQSENFRWMLEEFRVSLFAQELGTKEPVSVQRLRAKLEG